MTTVNSKEMAGVHVETRSGWPVGKVGSFDFEAETGHMSAMHVKASGLVGGLLAEDLIVPWNAIISMSKERVVIVDNAVPERARAIAKNRAPATNAILKEG